MKDFKTIKEEDILRMAWSQLLERVSKEEERNYEYKRKYGRTNEILDSIIKELIEQSNEIYERMLEIAQKN